MSKIRIDTDATHDSDLRSAAYAEISDCPGEDFLQLKTYNFEDELLSSMEIPRSGINYLNNSFLFSFLKK